MHPEVEELRAKLKEILYDCAVDIRATKAALYLFNGAGRFELVTEYGFRTAVRESADFFDPIVDRCGRGKTAFYVNGVGTEPRFSELLFQASTDRLLVAPLWQRGQLVGFIDMRDKAQKLPFDQRDASKAQTIADRIVDLFANRNLFGQRFLSLADQHPEPQLIARPPADSSSVAPPTSAARPPSASRPPTGPGTQPLPTPTPVPPAPPSPAKAGATSTGATSTGATSAKSAASAHVPPDFIQQARAATTALADPPPPAALSEHEVAAARDALKALLLIPGVVTATFSALGHGTPVQETVARAVLTDEAMAGLQSKLNAWLTRRGEAVAAVRMNVTTPFGSGGSMIGGAQLQKVFSAPLAAGSVRGLYLTVAFAEAPERASHDALTMLHRQMEISIEHSRQAAAYHQLRRRIAENLVEPDLSRYPELRHHSKLVMEKVEAFAKFLALSPEDVETMRIVALVHDVGLRLLDYERLYRKRGLAPEELGYLREHSRVSAAIVEPLLGSEIARAVLCHHERVDGQGYPHGLKGDAIPLFSRILQICDVYVSISDPHTYQLVEPPAAALATVARGAGTQFDGQLAAKFLEMMR